MPDHLSGTQQPDGGGASHTAHKAHAADTSLGVVSDVGSESSVKQNTTRFCVKTDPIYRGTQNVKNQKTHITLDKKDGWKRVDVWVAGKWIGCSLCNTDNNIEDLYWTIIQSGYFLPSVVGGTIREHIKASLELMGI